MCLYYLMKHAYSSLSLSIYIYIYIEFKIFVSQNEPYIISDTALL